jgi:alpha-amylase
MSTKNESDGSVHSYFSPYCSPYEAFINYMNVLSDFSLQIKKYLARNKKKIQKSLPSDPISY